MYDFDPILSRLKASKESAGYTNEELSARSGVPCGTINKILSGSTKEPKLPALMSIASALDVSVDYLLYGKISGFEARESELFRIIGELNDDGIDRLLDYARDISDLDRYKKGYQPSAMEKRA